MRQELHLRKTKNTQEITPRNNEDTQHWDREMERKITPRNNMDTQHWGEVIGRSYCRPGGHV